MSDLKRELHGALKASRSALLSRLDGLSEYDLRRPMTPTGTNLLGLVKHLAGLEYGYLGTSFGRPPPESLPWVDDGSVWENADMWARAEESSEFIIGLYERACEHADLTIGALSLDAPGSVAHWPADDRDTTLGQVLVLMVWETAQHAGHADIIRELVDGTAGYDDDVFTESGWQSYVAGIEAAASTFGAGTGQAADRASPAPGAAR
ncbi:MAG TPA: DinB family protein [Streptosporangiaceae bacterium]|nr:DinB family protein [Streptosporangiaceae bacterium]